MEVYYSTPASNWSQCIVGKPLPPSHLINVESNGGGIENWERDGLCGVGARYRSLACTRKNGVLVHPR